jgi:magnesium chelatase subunit D
MTAATPEDRTQDDAALAACLLAVDPKSLGGVTIKGDAREFLKLLSALMPHAAQRRLPLHISEGRLLGGLDLAATLQAGRPVLERGLLAEADGGVIIIPMAERMPAKLAALVVASLDDKHVTVERDGFAARTTAAFTVVALDESLSDEAGPPTALIDRLALKLDFGARWSRDTLAPPFSATQVSTARERLAAVAVPDTILTSLCNAAALLGIDSIRAPIFAVGVARAHASLMGRDIATEEDAGAAARLVLAPRATMLPVPQDEDEAEPPPPEPPQDRSDDQDSQQTQSETLDDIVLEAAKTAIPPGLLAMLQSALAARARSPSSGRADAARQIALRGRPVGTRRGELKSGVRLNLVETLRNAAPWQAVRKRDGANAGRVAVRREDFRITRFKPRSETATVFVVDASGSAAMHRLAEAKGAVELLLADCYVRRDQVALIAFRGKTAELILPLTRSLTRAKRTLSALPGGGGTPLAAAIDAATALADSIRRKGIAPTLVFLTDGRANVARDGAGGRERAQADVTAAARLCRLARMNALVLDISAHPGEAAQRFAVEMGGRYVPLPHADASSISQAVRSVMPADAVVRH